MVAKMMTRGATPRDRAALNARVRCAEPGTGTATRSHPRSGRRHGTATGPLFALALLLLSGAPLSAQTRSIEERHPLRADASVEINAVVHSISVERWNRDEIEILGEYDAEWEELVVVSDPRSFRFEVESLQRNRGRNRSLQRSAQLRVRVPAGVQLNIGSVSGEIQVAGVAGSVSASSVSGSVRVDGGSSSARLNSVSGRVTFQGSATSVDAQSVSGGVSVASSGAITSATVNSVSGSVSFEGALAQGGRLNISTHSGSVDLTLPPDVDARFSLSTFSGRVSSDLPGAEGEVHERGRYVPSESLRFTTGSGAGRVEAKSFSGNVRIRSGRR